MKSVVIFSAIAATALFGTTAAMATEEAGARFTATLDGASEAPGPGDADGLGTATVLVNPGREQLCYSVTVTGIAPARAAHIHEAAAGVAGPVVIALSAPTGGTSQGCVTVTRDFAKEFIKNPSDYYVNVHNAEFPRGAVRGQLGR